MVSASSRESSLLSSATSFFTSATAAAGSLTSSAGSVATAVATGASGNGAADAYVVPAAGMLGGVFLGMVALL